MLLWYTVLDIFCYTLSDFLFTSCNISCTCVIGRPLLAEQSVHLRSLGHSPRRIDISCFLLVEEYPVPKAHLQVYVYSYVVQGFSAWNYLVFELVYLLV